MLARMWRKGNFNLSMLLVGMQIGAATMENRMEFPQKIKNETAIHFHLRIFPKNSKIPNRRNISTPLFIAVLSYKIKV